MGLHTIILDAGPLLNNDPSISTLVAKCEKIYTTPAVLSELKDKDARARVQTTVLPFLTIKSPSPTSIKTITDFARKTGDLAVLSKTDIGILALAYELECERNQGDWRLRKIPGQKGLNGASPSASQPEKVHCAPNEVERAASSERTPETQNSTLVTPIEGISPKNALDDEFHNTFESIELDAGSTTVNTLRCETDHSGYDQGPKVTITPSKTYLQDLNDPPTTETTTSNSPTPISTEATSHEATKPNPATRPVENPAVSDASQPIIPTVDQDASVPVQVSEVSTAPEAPDQESSDSEGWITPANIKKHQAKDRIASTTPASEEKIMQVSTITSDFAMQNVLLQMNLNLLSPSLLRIKYLKTFILRCHACFQTTKQMDKQFCPRCGKPTLTRVSCSTNAKGEFQIYLKKNMQWNTRGDRYSIPKPVSGTAHGKFGNARGGGKGGWGQELILAEDQKEYMRAMQIEGRKKERNLMDEDYLPSILTGDRGKVSGRPKVGAGRNVNSKKRA